MGFKNPQKSGYYVTRQSDKGRRKTCLERDNRDQALVAEIRHNLDINLMNEQVSRHIWLNYVPPPPPPLAATSIPVHWFLGGYTVIRFV
jgi:hypothetical protein